MAARTASQQHEDPSDGVDLPSTAGTVLRGHFLKDCRVLVADDHRLYRDRLTSELEARGANVVCASDATSFCQAIDRPHHQLILVSYCIRGFPMILRLCATSGQAARLVVFGLPPNEPREIITCAESGVAGLHLRSESLEDLLIFCRQVLDGGTGCSSLVSSVLLRRLSEVGSKWPRNPESELLTVREDEVLDLINLGLSNREIAARLGVSTHTVKNHVHNVLNKLGVHSRAEAIVLSRVPDRTVNTARSPDPRGHRKSVPGTGIKGRIDSEY